MSSSTSIFVQTSTNYEEFVRQMEQFLGIQFTKRNDVPWSLSQFSGLGLQISLIGDLDYGDDEVFGLYFSQYSYQVRLQITHRDLEGRFWQQLEYALTMYLYSRISEDLNCKCMAVDDMEKLLAKN